MALGLRGFSTSAQKLMTPGGEARCTTRLWVFGSLASDWLLALPLQRPHIRLSTELEKRVLYAL
jgi:hypothetical protein